MKTIKVAGTHEDAFEVEGYVLGHMAYYKEHDKWVVAHLPSGQSVHTQLNNRRDAKSLAEVLLPVIPSEGEWRKSPFTYGDATWRAILETLITWLEAHGYSAYLAKDSLARGLKGSVA